MNIFKFFSNLFEEPSVNGAVKEINKAINKLEKAVAFQADKAEQSRIAANEALARNRAANEEADRARRIAKKMVDLLS